MKQSTTAFAHASDYCLSVINVGRANSLEDLRPAVEATTAFVNAGQVIGAMLLTGDVLAASAVKDAKLFGTEDQVHLLEFAFKYVKTTPLQVPSLGRAEDTPSVALNDANNETSHVLVTDADAFLNPKLKKAFCEPMNVTFCPPISLAQWLLATGPITISRKEENGGNKTYSALSDLKSDFASGALHPGDLKTNVNKAVVEALKPVREVFKEAALKKAQKDLETFAKKAAKA
jgi:tyrosyl-tRNA synthetase